MNNDQFVTKYFDVTQSIMLSVLLFVLFFAISTWVEILGLQISKLFFIIISVLCFAVVFIYGVIQEISGDYYFAGAKYTKNLAERIISMIISSITSLVFFVLTTKYCCPCL